MVENQFFNSFSNLSLSLSLSSARSQSVAATSAAVAGATFRRRTAAAKSSGIRLTFKSRAAAVAARAAINDAARIVTTVRTGTAAARSGARGSLRTIRCACRTLVRCRAGLTEC